MFSVGVLAFIFVDVMSNGISIVDDALTAFKDDRGRLSLRDLARRACSPAGSRRAAPGWRCSSAGCVRRPCASRRSRGGAEAAAVGATEPDPLALELDAARRRALRVGLTIAAAIGVHNFAEGLAIGVSARAGAISLATVLIIGFALHNATEGFGIVGPLGDVKPSWRWIGLAGLIGGGPTFLGSIVGYAVTSDPLELAFYAGAGGAILYVIGEIWNGMRRYGHRELGLLMVSAGFVVGVLTDLIVTYGGG